MNTRNAFSLHLPLLKSIAKSRLKALKQGDPVQWQIADSFFAHKPVTISDIKLSDVHWMIANELGVPSWAKLKHHIESQQGHREAMAKHSAPLDADKHTLHIRCGHDIQTLLPKAGFQGDYLAWIDPYCVGPLATDYQTRLEQRAEFVVSHYLNEMPQMTATVDAVIADEKSNMTQLNDTRYERIVLWVEHDSYDQFMLVYLLAHMPLQQRDKLELIEIEDFPGSERFRGLGQLPAEALRSCWSQRRKVTAEMTQSAEQVWLILCEPSPKALLQLSSLEHTASDVARNLPHIKPALYRHLQELPHQHSHLSLTQRLGFKALTELGSTVTLAEWFRRYTEHEPLPFLGDLMFYAVMKPFSETDTPWIAIEESDQGYQQHQITFTDVGIKAIEDGWAWHGAFEWVGGINPAEEFWCWDHQDLNTLAPR